MSNLLPILAGILSASSGSGTDFSFTSYTGNAGTLNVNTYRDMSAGSLVMTRRLAATYSNALYDTARGVGEYLVSDAPVVEVTNANSLTGFLSGGFTLGNAAISNAAASYAAFSWIEKPSFLDVVSYTGTGGSSRLITHSLNSSPKLMLLKDRDGADDWGVYHEALGNTKHLALNDASIASVGAGWWNNTSPNSSNFSVGAQFNANGQNYIAYLFGELTASSAFGSFAGNGSVVGPNIVTGFPPNAWIIKNTTDTGSWRFHWKDGADIYSINLDDTTVQADRTAQFALSSTGLQVVDTDSNINQSGQTYVYAVWG